MSGKYAILLAALLLMVVATFLWWFLSEPDVTRPIPMEKERPSEPVDPVVAVDTPLDAGSLEKEPVQTLGITTAEIEPSTMKPTDDSGDLRLNGTITVADESGSMYAAESGSFDLVLWDGNIGAVEKIQVDGGRWAIDVPRGLLFTVDDIVLNGRSAVLEGDDEKIPIPEDGFLALHALWLHACILHVRAEATGLELDGIELVGRIGWPQSEGEHPGIYQDENVILSSTRSPINLSESDPYARQSYSTTYFARSTGYAWGRIRIDHSKGGDRFLLLKPGGSLEVTLLGYDPINHAFLRIYPPAAGYQRPVLDLELGKENSFTIKAIAAGRYRLAVEIGKSWRDPLVLGTSEVEIVAGGRSYVTLALKAAPRAQTVPLAGMLIIPSAWTFDRFSLAIELLDTAFEGNPDRHYLSKDNFKPVAGLSDAYAWDAGMVQAGRYELNVDPPDYSISIEVPSGGLKEVLIELPPPASVSVLVIEASTGADAGIDELRWHPERPKWVSGGGLNTAKKNPKNGRFEFLAPRGEIEVSVWTENYQFKNRTLTVQAGLNLFTLKLEPACGIHVSLMDGKNTIQWQDDWDLSAEKAEGDGTTVGWSWDETGLLMRVSKPGFYRFKIPKIDGYLLVPDQEVVVEAGVVIKHVIHMKRDH